MIQKADNLIFKLKLAGLPRKGKTTEQKDSLNF